MLEHLQNPIFPVFILIIVLMIGYASYRAEILPGFIFFLFASMGAFLQITGIGQIGLFRAFLTPVLVAILVAIRIRERQRLPFFYWSLILLYMFIVYISGTLNGIPFANYRGDVGMLLLAMLVSLAPVKESTYRYFMLSVALWGLINMGAVMSGWMGLNIFGSYGSLFNEGGRAVGLMRHSTMMGIYFAISVIAAQVLFYQAMTRFGKIIWFIAGSLLFLGLLSSLSRGALAGWLVGFLFIQYKLRGMSMRAVLGITLTGAILVGVASFIGLGEEVAGRFTDMDEDISAQARIPLIISSFETWAESPVLGRGVGWKDKSLHLQSHNTYFQVLVESGAVGFIAFMTLMWVGLRGVFKRLKPSKKNTEGIVIYNTGIAAMLITILLDGLTHSFDFVLPYWILLGFGFML
ncbi:O-antigen ligase [Thiogranum longum]|uniref:O-antigen ligase n=1 Tax=Thiogranum longum TaxID=1537524 RepID=A0A4R1HGQ7_9GAMM|nr:O-antigen ligase family protein [Thiogranum longum]TCK19470.1 O-antigen ligase [Thiogranum longum]